MIVTNEYAHIRAWAQPIVSATIADLAKVARRELGWSKDVLARLEVRYSARSWRSRGGIELRKVNGAKFKTAEPVMIVALPPMRHWTLGDLRSRGLYLEYAAFAKDPGIGNCYYIGAAPRLQITVAHEFAHVVQYTRPGTPPGRPHGETFRRVYRTLRRVLKERGVWAPRGFPVDTAELREAE